MAVVPMVKVRLLTHRDDVKEVLEITQKIGAVEFHDVGDVEDFDDALLSTETNISPVLAKVTQAVTFLSNYETKLGTLETLKQGSSISVCESQLQVQTLADSQLSGALSDIEELQSELAAVNDNLRTANETKEAFAIWSTLTVPVGSFNTKYTDTYLVKSKDDVSNKKTDTEVSFVKKIEEAFTKAEVSSYIEQISPELASITVYKAGISADLMKETIKVAGAESVQLPSGQNTPIEEIMRLESEMVVLNDRKVELEIKAVQLTDTHLENIRIVHDVYVWKNERQEVYKVAKATKRLAVFEGWCDELELPALKNSFAKLNLSCEIVQIIPKEGEQPPVELKNNSLIQPFEIVTRLYGLPEYKNLDPTPYLAGFFFLFFGLSLTDVGYGLFLMTVALTVIFYFKVSATVKLFAKLLFVMGLSSALVGLIFGGYLGIDPALLPEILRSIQVFDPIGNPLPVFYLALSLGVVQVMFGMMLKIYSDAKNDELMTGILDQGPWLLLFATLIAYGASDLGYLDISGETALSFIYIAIIAVVVASGRTGKTILGKLQMSLLSLYNSIGYFSDILSYSRLLALGLATTALAFAVNLIAGLVQEMIPYVGIVFAIIILIVGHLFTLLVNTLGGFIHSARLQFVEFFGKFITGTGRAFKPLNRKESYITIVKDSG